MKYVCFHVFGEYKLSFSTTGARPSKNRIRMPLSGLNFMKKNDDGEVSSDNKGRVDISVSNCRVSSLHL